jgi:hypothetical protein
VRFLRRLESFIGMFHCLPGMLLAGLVIFFSVMHGGSTVRVGGELVKFRSSLVRISWHMVFHPRQPLHLRTSPFLKLFNAEHPGLGHPASVHGNRCVACLRDSAPATLPGKLSAPASPRR